MPSFGPTSGQPVSSLPAASSAAYAQSLNYSGIGTTSTAFLLNKFFAFSSIGALKIFRALVTSLSFSSIGLNNTTKRSALTADCLGIGFCRENNQAQTLFGFSGLGALSIQRALNTRLFFFGVGIPSAVRYFINQLSYSALGTLSILRTAILSLLLSYGMIGMSTTDRLANFFKTLVPDGIGSVRTTIGACKTLPFSSIGAASLGLLVTLFSHMSGVVVRSTAIVRKITSMAFQKVVKGSGLQRKIKP